MGALDLKGVHHVQTLAPEGVLHDGTAKAGFRVIAPLRGFPSVSPALNRPLGTTAYGAQVLTWSTPFRSNASVQSLPMPWQLYFVVS